MKIVHVIASINPSHGGPSVCAPSLAVAQARLGHQVSLVFPADRDFDDYGLNLKDVLPILKEVKLVGIPMKKGAHQYIFGDSARALADVVSGADIVHVHGLWDAILIFAMRICRRSNTQYVITPHGMLNRWSLAHKAGKKRLALNLILSPLLRNSEFIQALNQNEACDIRAIDKRFNVKVFPNGIFPEQFEDIPAGGTFRTMFETGLERPYLLFLGRLHFVKGLDLLIDSFRKVADHTSNLDLVIAGPDDGYASHLEARIRDYNLEPRVHMAGPLYGRVKYAAIVDALCLVQPSRQEGFSMSIAEALACGKPVVISESCHFPEVSTHGAGHVVPLEVTSLAHAMIEVATDASRRSDMGARGRVMMHSHYTWHHIAEQMVAAYDAGISSGISNVDQRGSFRTYGR